MAFEHLKRNEDNYGTTVNNSLSSFGWHYKIDAFLATARSCCQFRRLKIYCEELDIDRKAVKILGAVTMKHAERATINCPQDRL